MAKKGAESSLHVRIPARLHRELRMYCVEADIHLKDFAAQALKKHLEEAKRPNNANGLDVASEEKELSAVAGGS